MTIGSMVVVADPGRFEAYVVPFGAEPLEWADPEDRKVHRMFMVWGGVFVREDMYRRMIKPPPLVLQDNEGKEVCKILHSVAIGATPEDLARLIAEKIVVAGKAMLEQGDPPHDGRNQEEPKAEEGRDDPPA